MTAPYAEWADSGIPWIGQIPKGWKVKKFRYLFRESSEKIEGEVLGEMLSVSGYRGVEVKVYDDENRKRLDEDLIGYRIVRPGQLVVNTMWLNYAGLGISHFEGYVSPAYRAYSFVDGTDLNPRFAHYLLRCSSYVQGYTQLLTGVRPNSLQMSRNDLMAFPVLIPPLGNQTIITAFLDRETAKIDALVEEQKRLIDLLKEKRQAVFSHAVTKGLNPDAPMKNSGIEWLGEVPEHWEVAPLKHFARIGNGSTPNRDRSEYWAGGAFPWLNSSVVNSKSVEEADQFVTTVALKECHLPIVQPPAILIGITGQGRTRGMATLLRIEATINQHVAYVIPSRERASCEYLLAFFEAAYERLRTDSEVGSTKGAITCEQLSRFKVPLPSVSEQAAILEQVETAAQQFETLIASADAAIALLQERRAALISAAVTGKIDVRSVAQTRDAAE